RGAQGRPRSVAGPAPPRRGYRSRVDRARREEPARTAEAGASTAVGCRCARRGPRGMSLYLDTSALLKRYIEEEGSAAVDRILESDSSWVTARHTWVEMLRNLARLIAGDELRRIEKAFRRDWATLN